MKIILLGALLAPFFVSAQTLFDNSQSQPQFEVAQTLYKVGSSNADKSLYKPLSTVCATAPAPDDVTGPHYSSTRDCYVKNYWGTGQAYRIEWTIDTWSIDGEGNEYNRAESFANTTLSYYEGTVIKCGEDANGATSFTFTKNDLCYDPVELATNDTCDTGNLFQAQTSDDLICSTKADGSMCQSERVISVLFSPNGSGACYVDAEQANSTVFPELPTPDTCEVGLDGYLFCASNGEESNGFDEDKLCGTYNIGNGQTEVCFDKDNDSDLVPNHLDTDLDGDGVPNDDDPDVDDDGVLNADDPDYTPSSGVGTGTGGDNDTGSGGGGGVTGDINSLIELVDINSDSAVEGLNVIGSNFSNGLDEFLADENLNMVDTINSNGVGSSMDMLKNIVTPTACSLSFTAPFRGGMTIELCSYVEPLKPILAVLFAVGTFIYGFRRIFQTISGAQ